MLNARVYQGLAASGCTAVLSYMTLNGNNSRGSTKCRNESIDDHQKKIHPLQRRLTSIGRFSLQSQTAEYPSQPVGFVVLQGKTPMSVKELSEMWNRAQMDTKHERFALKVNAVNGLDLEPVSSNYNYCDDDDTIPKLRTNPPGLHATREVLHPVLYKEDLKNQIEHLLMDPLDVTENLWECYVSNGTIGVSGGVDRSKVIQSDGGYETIVMLRAHHALGDGVSMNVAFTDLTDEAEEIQEFVNGELKKRQLNNERVNLQWYKRLFRSIARAIWMVFKSIESLIRHGFLIISSSSNPFDLVLSSADKEILASRVVSWCDVAPIEEVKEVAKSIHPNATINDLFVSCVSAAIVKQLKVHYGQLDPCPILPNKMNIVCPVHLNGGVLLPGQSLGNRIGAFVAQVPGNLPEGDDDYESAAMRLKSVSESLYSAKNSPDAIISWLMARFCSNYLPLWLTKSIMQTANANAVAVVSNVRGPPTKLHWNGRPVVNSVGFLPLPPTVPIGLVVTSYDGLIKLSVNATKAACPDADLFLHWVLQEYNSLKKKSSNAKIKTKLEAN